MHSSNHISTQNELMIDNNVDPCANLIIDQLGTIGESWSPHNHSYPEKMFPSNVLISLEAEKNPLSLIENPHKSPFRKFFYDHSKVELFSF